MLPGRLGKAAGAGWDRSSDSPIVSDDRGLDGEILPPVRLTRVDLSTAEKHALVEQIRAEHETGERSLKEAVRHFRKRGEKLLQPKSALGHGHFAHFLKTKAKLHPRTAQRYMMLAREMAKLPAADATRMPQLSLRDAIGELARMSSRAAKLQPASLDRALIDARRQPLKRSVANAVNTERDAPLSDLPVVKRVSLPVEPQPPAQNIQSLADALRRTVRAYVDCHPEMGVADICAAYYFAQDGELALGRVPG
jgi:hypothetical protein